MRAWDVPVWRVTMKTPKLEVLKKKISRLPVNSMGSRKPYPRKVKEAVVALAEEWCGSGQTQAALVEELGINEGTLWRWRREMGTSMERRGKVREIQVVEDKKSNSARTLILPNGVRVEGLELDELVVLVRELT